MKWLWITIGAAALIAVIALLAYYGSTPATEPVQQTGIEIDVDAPRKQKPPKQAAPRKAARR